MSLFVNSFDGERMCYNIDALFCSVSDLVQRILYDRNYPPEEIKILHNGKVVDENENLRENGTYHVVLGLKGGKGGFGAMLRMLGAQIEKTTNREACRDLSGRRMRDVNNEKKLQSWIEKAKQLEEEREERRRKKLERMRSQPKHFFVDPSYDQQKEAVLESLEEAVSKGIDAAGPSGSRANVSGKLKRKIEDEDDDEDDDDDDDEDDPEFKKLCQWLGVDGVDEEDEEEEGAKPIKTTGEFTDPNPGTREQSTSNSSTRSSSPLPPTTTTDSVTSSSSSSPSPSLNRVTESSESGDADTTDIPPISEQQKSSLATIQSENESGPIDLEEYSSASELEELGLDRLKSALMDRGMKCGGTLQERAQRLYSVKGVDPADIDPSLLAKAAKGKKGKKK